MGNPINNFLARYDLDINELLTFRLEKTVTIQVWQVGLFYRLVQMAVVVYVAMSMHAANSWAYTEVPMGTVNAWPENGDFFAHASLDDFSALPYCDNASFSYAYDESFNMDQPYCEVQHPYEVTTKGPGQLIFATAFIEVGEIGWACSDVATGATQRQACAARGGSALVRGRQCLCVTTRTVYPVGVDRMSMAFEHSIAPATADSHFSAIAASSNEIRDPDRGVRGIESRIVFANESVMSVRSGRAIRLPLEQWLAAAATDQSSSIRNITLDAYNTDLSADYRDASRFPPFRSAGVALQVTIEYNNLNLHDQKPGYDNQDVVAHIRPKATTTQWAGNGPITHYNLYPSNGGLAYDKVFRYRQGVVVTFRTSGRLYKMDWMFLMNSIITGLVLLSIAKTVATVFAMYLAPNAEMIKNRTREYFNVEKRYADISMKTVQRAMQFEAIDHDKDGQLEVADLMQTLGNIKHITFDQAWAVAHLVMESADSDTVDGPRAKTSTSDVTLERQPTGLGKVDFAEFLLASEPDRMISFDKFLEMAPKMAKINPKTDRDACMRAFLRVRQNKAYPDSARYSYQDSTTPLDIDITSSKLTSSET